MSQNDLLLMAVAVGILALLVRWQIAKLSQRVASGEAILPSVGKRDYSGFCETVDQELDRLKEACKEDGASLETVAAFAKELVFIQSMGENVSNERWEEKLFGFLSRVDEFVLTKLGQEYLDEMKARLMAAYSQLR